MESSEHIKIENKLCPKCGFYMLGIFNDEDKIVYFCPVCGYKEFPE